MNKISQNVIIDVVSKIKVKTNLTLNVELCEFTKIKVLCVHKESKAKNLYFFVESCYYFEICKFN